MSVPNVFHVSYAQILYAVRIELSARNERSPEPRAYRQHYLALVGIRAVEMLRYRGSRGVVDDSDGKPVPIGDIGAKIISRKSGQSVGGVCDFSAVPIDRSRSRYRDRVAAELREQTFDRSVNIAFDRLEALFRPRRRKAVSVAAVRRYRRSFFRRRAEALDSRTSDVYSSEFHGFITSAKQLVIYLGLVIALPITTAYTPFSQTFSS